MLYEDLANIIICWRIDVPKKLIKGFNKIVYREALENEFKRYN